MKKWFPRLSVKDICLLGLLVAITVVLAIYGTFRIGEIIKIPVKFVSVFVTAVLYGPIYGGVVAVLGDLFNCLIMPSGAFLPQITALEFLNGFVFGVFFFKSQISVKSYVVRMVLCSVILFAIDMFITSAVLVSVGIFPSFEVAFVTRIWAGLIKLALHMVAIFALRTFLDILRRLKR